MKTLVLANQKGGVGKSAVACQLAYYWHSQEKRVLFLDLDHQRNSTDPLVRSGKATIAAFTTGDVLQGKAAPVPVGNFVLVPGDDKLSDLEREKASHNSYANNLHAFLKGASNHFDVCIIDTNPNPDIRYASALIVGDYVLSPIQLNQEAISGVGALINHPRYGYRNIKAKLNKTLELIGLLPNLVEATPFQKSNFEQLMASFAHLLIVIDASTQRYACIPTRTAIAEAQAGGHFLAEMPKTSAKQAWREIRPSFEAISNRMNIGA